MPLVIILLIALMIAMFGFWDTIGAVLGGVVAVLLLTIVLFALGVSVAASWLRRKRGTRSVPVRRPAPD